MEGYTKFPERKLYILLAAAGAVIFLSSIEVLMRVKDSGLFYVWQADMMRAGIFPEGVIPTFDDYAAAELFRYAFKIAIPVGFGLLTFVTYKKLRLTKLYVFIWTVLLAGGMAYTFFELNFGSIFYYLVVAGYLLMIAALLSVYGETGSRNV